MRIVYVYLLDTMADWEHGYLLQALSLQSMAQKEKLIVQTIARVKAPIKTAGVMTLVPDKTLAEVDIHSAAALVLIGADTWLEKEQADILSLAAQFIENDILVAAICGATLGLADKGLLDDRKHTSNASFFLKMSANYKGSDYYREELAVYDKGIITASSAGSLLWAKRIIEQLDIYSDRTIGTWFDYFSTGEPAYYGELVASLQDEAKQQI